MTTKMEKKMIGAFYKLSEESVQWKKEKAELQVSCQEKDKQIADQDIRIKDLEEKISRKDAYIHWLDAAYHHQYAALENIKQGNGKL
jgi:hypothetical protein